MKMKKSINRGKLCKEPGCTHFARSKERCINHYKTKRKEEERRMCLPIKVGITGTRYGMSNKQKDRLQQFLKEKQILEIHHGKCIGADEQAHTLALDKTANIPKIIIHPPVDKRLEAKIQTNCDELEGIEIIELEPKEYILRNHDIVDSVDVLVATPKTKYESVRSGTWSTVRYARKKGIIVIILY